ncbi:MAG: hypothetical protein QOD24_275 [Solirubrobacteraceae bacterium]|jgi:AcrR family transcriptional regulator|nr:hypothetical protein [Solirubrobacteraceae bacterium]
MSTPYEMTGRTRQKARTRTAMVDATRRFLAEGLTPTVEAVAARADVSRTTAYRYFPNQRALLLASYPELGETSLLDDDAPEDPVARLDLVAERIGGQLLEHERELRMMLRLSLDAPPTERAALPLRQGRAIGWIEDGLAPARSRLSPRDFRRLVLAVRATLGIEALVWLTDVAGLSQEESVDIMRSSARTLVQAALDGSAGRRRN